MKFVSTRNAINSYRSGIDLLTTEKCGGYCEFLSGLNWVNALNRDNSIRCAALTLHYLPQMSQVSRVHVDCDSCTEPCDRFQLCYQKVSKSAPDRAVSILCGCHHPPNHSASMLQSTESIEIRCKTRFFDTFSSPDRIIATYHHPHRTRMYRKSHLAAHFRYFLTFGPPFFDALSAAKIRKVSKNTLKSSFSIHFTFEPQAQK